MTNDTTPSPSTTSNERRLGRRAMVGGTAETILRWGVGDRHGPGHLGMHGAVIGHQRRRWEGLAETCAWRERSGVEGAVVGRDRVGPRPQIRPGDHHPRLDEKTRRFEREIDDGHSGPSG